MIEKSITTKFKLWTLRQMNDLYMTKHNGRIRQFLPTQRSFKRLHSSVTGDTLELRLSKPRVLCEYGYWDFFLKFEGSDSTLPLWWSERHSLLCMWDCNTRRWNDTACWYLRHVQSSYSPTSYRYLRRRRQRLWNFFQATGIQGTELLAICRN